MDDVTYPMDWGGEAFLRSDYVNGEEMGLFIVDTLENKVVEANVRYAYNGSSWTTSFGDTIHYKPSYVFYSYYPYKSALSNVSSKGDTYHAAGKTAEDFFSSLIANWAVSIDQSDEDKLAASDLQVAKYKGTPYLRFNMTHQLGLAKITLETNNVPKTKFVAGGTGSAYTVTSYYSVEKINQKASNVFDGAELWCPNSDETVYYLILKGTVNKTFSSSSTGINAWKSSLTATIKNKECYTGLAELKTKTDYIYDGWYYVYTGSAQTFTASANLIYQIDCWGAQGGASNGRAGGKGGYATGKITFTTSKALYVYVGQSPAKTTTTGGWNGGGNGNGNQNQVGYGGGGATDIRMTYNATWSDTESLMSRIMVAGGGGASGQFQSYYGIPGAGGGINGVNGSDGGIWGATYSAGGGKQDEGGNSFNNLERAYNNGSNPVISNTTYNKGTFGIGGSNLGGYAISGAAAGGGGWYGGGAATRGHGGAGGGSSYVSGLEGCYAISSTATTSNITHDTTTSIHPTGIAFTDAQTIAGNETQPAPAILGGTQVGREGNGFVEITCLTPR